MDLDEKITPTDLKLLQSNPSTETRAQFAAKFGRQYDAFSATSSKEFADTILYHLAKDVEVTVRQALAETIAESLDLPNAIAMELGTDDIDIARPVLERSAVLQDPQLTEIIQSQADYYAFAIAGRQTISEDVSDSLIASENTDTIVRLLNNEGASFSEDGLLRLATDFAGNSHIQEHLVKLPNLPPDVVDRLIDGIGETLEWDLITSRSIEPTEARRLVNAMKGQASKALAKRSAAQLAGSDDLQDRMAKGVLNPLDILSFLRDGNVGKFEIALSTIAKVDLKHTRRLLYNLDKRAIAALCLRANMGTPQYMAIRMALDLADSGVSDVHAKRVKYPLKTTRFVQDQYERLRKDEKTIRQFF
ncbi:MAG: DUF2336 domain-containing protein [Pseudomonadota bacterium]